jgi:1-pyrroline-5-carboxylate dehydrogenase
MTQIYGDQPSSSSDMWNRLEYRPLEGFVYAITHLTLLRLCNLPASAAMMGNVVIWKPSDSQVSQHKLLSKYSKKQVFLMELST